MNVRQIVITHLKAEGFDGLAGEDCGCGLDDLMPCENYRLRDCKPATRIVCKDEGFSRCRGCFGECNSAEKETAHLFVTTTDPGIKKEETHL